MCFAFDARPPDIPADLRPIAGGAGAELLELESADGTRFSAALAESPEASGRAVVILPDVRGLYPFYSELAERFASAGHHAIAIDYFGRTAGLGPRDEEFDYWPHVAETRPATVQADIAAALAALRERTGEERASTVGFCFGGTQSFLAATNAELDFDGVVGFYGGLNPERWGDMSPSTAPARCAARSWGSTAAPTRASRPSRSRRSSATCPRHASSTRSSPTREPRTRSSTAASRSTPARARTPGDASWRSST